MTNQKNFIEKYKTPIASVLACIPLAIAIGYDQSKEPIRAQEEKQFKVEQKINNLELKLLEHKVNEEKAEINKQIYERINNYQNNSIKKNIQPKQEKIKPNTPSKPLKFIQELYTKIAHRGKVKNNNPCNLKAIPGKPWAGQKGVDYRGFAIFENEVYGLRGWLKNAWDSEKMYGTDTVHEIISKCSPPNENDTNGYIRFVAENLGVSPHEKINLKDKDKAMGLLSLVAKKESSAKYPKETYEQAYTMLTKTKAYAKVCSN